MRTPPKSPNRDEKDTENSNNGYKRNFGPGWRSYLATATAPGARRACTASASPPTGSPAAHTGNQKKKKSQIVPGKRHTPNPEETASQIVPSSSSHRAMQSSGGRRRRIPSRRRTVCLVFLGGVRAWAREKNPRGRRGGERGAERRDGWMCGGRGRGRGRDR